MSEVRTLSGRRLDWHNPPHANAMCSLVLNDEKYKGSFRTLCHLNRLNNLAIKRFGTGVTVIQSDWHTGVPASAGTHDYDSCWDLKIEGVGWWRQQRFFRANGFACWYRHPPLFGNHIHGFTLPPHRGSDPNEDFRRIGIKVGKYIDGEVSLEGHVVVSSQIHDFYHHAFGLAGQHEAGSDSSWFPQDIAATAFNLRAYVQRRAA